MGCDCHVYVETKLPNGNWATFPPTNVPCEWCNGTGKSGNGTACFSCNGSKVTNDPQGWYHSRNYNVFAILADVRNNYGFTPIAMPRGIPEDTAIIETHDLPYDERTYVSFGDHSFSWLLLQEILDYDWDQPVAKHGMVSVAEYKEWATKGKPNSWSGGVGGGGVRIIDAETMGEFIKTGQVTSDPRVHYYAEVHWEDTCRASCAPFLQRMELLRERAAKEGFKPSDVRLVFGFDS